MVTIRKPKYSRNRKHVSQFLREQRLSRQTSGEPPYIDPVPDYILKHLLDGNDAGLIPILSPLLVSAPSLPDKKGYELNGVDQVINADAHSSAFGFGTGAFSISFWLKSVITGVNSRITSCGTGGSGTGDFEIFQDGTGRIRLRYNNVSKDIVPAGSATTGNWEHVTVTVSGTSGTLIGYLNGVNVTSTTAHTYNAVDSGFLRYGARPSGDLRLAGSLDEIRVYHRAISPAEVALISGNKE
jgi:hypothetical protein